VQFVRFGARSRLWMQAALVIVVGASTALYAWRRTGPFGEWIYVVGTGFPAIVAAIGLKLHPPGRRRTTWALIAGGVAASAIGDAIYAWLAVAGEEPDISVADVGWLTAYVLLALGLFRLVMGEERRVLDVDALIDMAVVATVGIVVLWEETLSGTFGDTSVAPFVRTVWGAYPILDAALLATVVRLVMSSRGRSVPALLVTAGVAGWLVSDFAYIVADGGDVGFVFDAGWIIGAALIGAAVLSGQHASRAVVRADRVERVGPIRIALGLIPLLVPWLYAVRAYRHGDTLPPAPLVLATVALIVLAFVRSSRLFRAVETAHTDLRLSHRHFEALAMNSSDGVLVVDPSGRLVGTTQRTPRSLDLGGDPTPGRSVWDYLRPDDRDTAQAILQKAVLAPGSVHSAEVCVPSRDGGCRWLVARVVNLVAEPAVGGLVINLQDVTERKQIEEQLAHQALHDSLTGLANRSLLRDRLELALRRSQRSGTHPAVLYLDLDGFKSVNDTLGHDAGDAMLVEVARRLTGAIRAGDTVSRLGGDEFAILIEQTSPDIDEASTTADRVLQVLGVPVEIDGQLLGVSVSIGIAIADEGATATSLLRDADIAMYQAKSAGRGRWVDYQPEMRVDALERHELSRDLLTAVDQGQLRLLYQPVVEIKTGRTVGVEALLRWVHPTRGVILPDQFIPIAESTGQIVEIGEWVLAEACQAAVAWQPQPPAEPLSVAVNLSARQLASDRIVEAAASALERSGLPASALVLEITETTLITDAGAVAERLHALRRLGVRLAIDDFGTGYSSLNYLRQFPIDILKIDKSFIDAIQDLEGAPAIVRGLLDLGHTLDLEIIAEGVEESHQREWLEDEHCRLGQGFLFARPMTEQQLSEHLATRREVLDSGR
jgi:diguanylate cyclase (GGDEF)-like protein/PAS domain S-box-containing protein